MIHVTCYSEEFILRLNYIHIILIVYGHWNNVYNAYGFDETIHEIENYNNNQIMPIEGKLKFLVQTFGRCR